MDFYIDCYKFTVTLPEELLFQRDFPVLEHPPIPIPPKNTKTSTSHAAFVGSTHLQLCRVALMFWSLRCRRFISPPHCHGTLNKDDSFWSQALQDLETCGQSEILRELEASMTGSTLSLYLEETKASEDSMFHSEISPIKQEQSHSETKNKSLNFSTGARDGLSRAKGDPTDMLSPSGLAVLKVSIRKDLEIHDFGFSVSDGLFEKGVYVNMIRPAGPADQAGLKPFDRILQVNRVRTRDLDCCLTVPLITEAGDCLDLVISRNPLAAADMELPSDCDRPSNSLLCFANYRTNSIAL